MRIPFRYTDEDNRYYAELKVRGQLGLYKVVNGVTTALASKSYSVTAGDSYEVRIAVSGTGMSLFVNGSQELSAVDSAIAEGKFGLGTYHAEGKFDNVFIAQ